MPLLNDPASVPTAMLIVTRHLVGCPGRRQNRQTLKATVSPASLLPPGRHDSDTAFEYAVKTLLDLGIAAEDGEQIALADVAKSLTPDDVAAFDDLLRRQALDPSRNENIADSGNQTGPKDLVRALSWFLTLDPYSPMSHDDVVQKQRGAIAESLGNPFVNDFRWNRFTYWAPALGFAAPPLIPRLGTKSQTLVPDCTTAVRRTMQAKWPPGTRLPARDAVAAIIDELPVLPGGRYSVALGLAADAPDVSATLSFALLCADEYGWLQLHRRSDADDEVLLVDPDQSNGTRRVTHLDIMEPIDE
ncbi:protein DpdG [Micromonospora aurantiaca (nom. illeg.)]|uniref:protein DpdG n=1 Tax=Micromonospora aurantiaca (nom. illeg.) TaxID=47850 RepID=UPI0033D3847D